MPAKLTDDQREELACGQRLLHQATRERGRTVEGRLPVVVSYMLKGEIKTKGFRSKDESKAYLRQERIDDASFVALHRRSEHEIYFI